MVVATFATPARRCFAALFCAVLASHGAMARTGSDGVFFEVVKLPNDESPAPPAPNTRIADTRRTDSTDANTATLQALITALEESGDLSSPALAEYATQLGHALQRNGDHVAALAAFDRSLQILRRQEGLHSTAQAAILQSKFDSQLALGNLEACDTLQQARFAMQVQLFAAAPPRLAEAYASIADWEVRYYLMAAEAAPQISGATDEQAALAERLAQAFLHYHTAASTLATVPGTAHYSDMVMLERKIAAITRIADQQYQHGAANLLTNAGQHSALTGHRKHQHGLFAHGTSALARTVAYSEALSQPELIAERQLELADWYLLMDQPDQALALYDDAARRLREAGMPQARIAAIMQSGMPVRDPAKDLTALAEPVPGTGFDGYVDVTLDIDRYGQASNTQVADGEALSSAVEQRLLERIREDRFRPSVEDGTLVDSKNVTLRYYFAQ